MFSNRYNQNLTQLDRELGKELIQVDNKDEEFWENLYSQIKVLQTIEKDFVLAVDRSLSTNH